ncbi:MAG: GNAT family N-acetyltransferase [Deltaproteobacteria bacterium]|nr:GNAT family N-acetyltransferase [Deltaproteobacteria bacterium]
MTIRLSRATLRPFVAADAPAVARRANNENVARGLRDGFPHPYTEADARAFIAKVAAETRGAVLCIEVDGEVAGGVGVHPDQDVRLTAEVGYWIAEPYRGRGHRSGRHRSSDGCPGT